MKAGHGNVAIFVPHIGCPKRCSFCDQNAISGETAAPTPQDVKNALELAALKGGSKELELAFFGGSFTGIERSYMISLLEAAAPFLGSLIMGIRISTRPDYIDGEILQLLKNYGVTSIELGSQSMCDDVLTMNNRGHLAMDTKTASKLIKEAEFSLGLQMMTGLYGSTPEKDLFTAEEIVKLSPDTVRIYPTITIKNTLLGKYYEEGKYTPPTLEETISLCAKLTMLFWENDIKVIKTGLHASQELEEKMLAGPYHPSLGELVMNEIMLSRLLEQLKDIKNQDIVVQVANGEISKMVGQNRRNMIYLEKMGIHAKIIQSDGIPPLYPKLKV